MKSRNVIVCRPGHKLTRRKKVTIADFEAATWIGHSRESVLSADMRSTLADLGVDLFNVVFESNSAGGVLTLVREGDYLTVLPLLSVAQRLAAGELATLPTPRSGPERWTAIITRADSAQSAAMTDLKKALAEEITAVVPLLNQAGRIRRPVGVKPASPRRVKIAPPPPCRHGAAPLNRGKLEHGHET